ncbi:hypothetical protein [Pseudorhizobium pelagicum]|uniref:Uncharacterized protein n=1 Tax=Pseudorhizobium pelagicum TaxID=1509405 RepID=A0A922NXU2_9HYPH|nr:hypothetical protein [Pseudorhizobium pelagicum]KEQ04239.1 hypothetical protein GV67_11235 [Pseudorhizobium pelagicum]KEQ04403.1 hypothetical protein GV68_13045 [Pseudorhizobium pelagicum]
MHKSLASAIAATVIASAIFAGSAMAQSTQYQSDVGSQRNLDNSNVERSATGSIYPDARMGEMSNTDIDNSQDRGDYYEGALRPTN